MKEGIPVNSSVLPPIPWDHVSGEMGSSWTWETPHFLVRVTGDARSCYYAIMDKVAAQPGENPRVIADGQTSTFEQAENMVRGTIGKSYKPSLGYAVYAGPLATTFTISSGQPVDLGVYAGQRVAVTVLNRDGAQTTFEGVASVVHYDFVLTIGNRAVKISPPFIVTVERAGAPRDRQSPPGPRVSRTVTGDMVPGCTGRPGFLAGTVEHEGRLCPVHEN